MQLACLAHLRLGHVHQGRICAGHRDAGYGSSRRVRARTRKGHRWMGPYAKG
jgi:hypothetical protein